MNAPEQLTIWNKSLCENRLYCPRDWQAPFEQKQVINPHKIRLQLMTPKFLHQEEQWTDLDLPYQSVDEYGSYRKHPPTMHQLQWIWTWNLCFDLSQGCHICPAMLHVQGLITHVLHERWLENSKPVTSYPCCNAMWRLSACAFCVTAVLGQLCEGPECEAVVAGSAQQMGHRIRISLLFFQKWLNHWPLGSLETRSNDILTAL